MPSIVAPRVLLLATGSWVGTARLSMALSALGCEVHLLALPSHPALVTGTVAKHYTYNPLSPLRSVRDAIAHSDPLTLIPVDELAVSHLEELATTDSALHPLITRSLGGLHVLPIARSRMGLLALARQQAIAVPLTLPVVSPYDLPAVAQRLSLPFVLKSDASSGGQGVRTVHTLAEARSAWRALHNPPSLPRALKRALIDHDRTHLRPWLTRATRGVTAQQFLTGTERTSLAVAHHGTLLASFHLEVVRTWCHHGPSSVVRIIDDPTMDHAIHTVVHHLGLTGFCGFDFMVSANNTPLLIEMNPRPTQLAHLTLGPGRDLAAAYVRTILGLNVPDRSAATNLDLIALFPLELQRDPSSPYLTTAYHDVPRDSPNLIRRLTGKTAVRDKR